MGLGLGRIVSLVASFAVSWYTGNWAYFIAASSSAHQARVAERDRRRAVAAFNASLHDRLEMEDLPPDQPRTLVMGVVRYVEGVRRRWSSGANREKATFIVSFAGHEIDAFVKWYLFDDEVTLDVDGWVERTSNGTGTGYTTTAAGFAIGTTSLPLISGTGTVLAGDTVLLDGDTTRYKVATGIAGPGTLVLEAPGLRRAVGASAIPVTLYQTPYHGIKRESVSDSATLDGSGGVVFGLSQTPVPGTAFATWASGNGDSRAEGSCSVSVTGSTATVTGGQGGATVTVAYSVDNAIKRVRIRPYLGAATQNVGADLAAEYPGELTADDAFAGMPLAVMDCIFDTDVFPQGRPTLTALMRAAKVYDPRLDSTVPGGSGAHRIDDETTWEFSECPALLADHYRRWPYGWNVVDAAAMPPEDLAAEADVCDDSTGFTLTATGGGTTTVTLPRYRCGITIPADADPNSRRAAMDAIMETMAGSDGWDGGVWRFRAGAMAAATFTLDTTWLASKVSAAGKADTEPVLRGANAFSRDQRINRVTGSCADPDQRWQLLPFPAIEDSVLVAAKGSREEAITFDGVNHIAHAQNLASVAIRQAQAGTRIEALCNLKAYSVRLFSVGTILLPRQGMDVALDKKMEVIGRRWSPAGGIRLQLAEISDDEFAADWVLNGRDPAPDSSLPKPWQLEQITGVAVTSGTAALTDAGGSIITRTQISWDAAAGENIRQGGEIEVQYALATDAFPAGDWPSWSEPGASTKAVIPGLQAGRFYWFRVRAVQKLPLVRGAWSDPPVRALIDVPRTVDTSGLTPNAATEVLTTFVAGPVSRSSGA